MYNSTLLTSIVSANFSAYTPKKLRVVVQRTVRGPLVALKAEEQCVFWRPAFCCVAA